MENKKENKQKPAAIDMKYVSGARMSNVQVRGYDTALRAEHVYELDMKNVSAEKNTSQLNQKWYKDRMFLLSILAIAVSIFIAWKWN